jgi:hypothetical protein
MIVFAKADPMRRQIAAQIHGTVRVSGQKRIYPLRIIGSCLA